MVESQMVGELYAENYVHFFGAHRRPRGVPALRLHRACASSRSAFYAGSPRARIPKEGGGEANQARAEAKDQASGGEDMTGAVSGQGSLRDGTRAGYSATQPFKSLLKFEILLVQPFLLKMRLPCRCVRFGGLQLKFRDMLLASSVDANAIDLNASRGYYCKNTEYRCQPNGPKVYAIPKRQPRFI